MPCVERVTWLRSQQSLLIGTQEMLWRFPSNGGTVSQPRLRTYVNSLLNRS